MPEQEGLETIQALIKEHPDLRIIVMSGAAGLHLIQARCCGSRGRWAPKPVCRSRFRPTRYWKQCKECSIRHSSERWPLIDGRIALPLYRPGGSSSSQCSPKKPTAATLPAQRSSGGVAVSTTAKSGSLGIWRALFRSSYSRNVTPLLSTTYFFGFSGLG